jgi:hypothetical protein
MARVQVCDPEFIRVLQEASEQEEDIFCHVIAQEYRVSSR